MENVQTQIKGNKLIITVDITKDLGLSKTGKTIKVASTGGFQTITENGKSAMINLNVNRYPKAKE
jgi:hypothetical protein